MTFLPIVERELRAAARRSATYRMRVGAAVGAMLVGAAVLVVTFGAPPQQVGRYTFTGLSALALLYAVAAGRRWTADCLSQEKREGTLGLLFLTDLKGHDVVLGKLAATSLGGFYALFGLVPILAVPLLLGGVTNGEFWRAALVLVNTFLFSLAIGVCGSALSRDVRRAMAANLALLLILTLGPPAVAGLTAYFSPSPAPFKPVFFLSCPVFSYLLCSDASYRTASLQFWLSILVIQALTWCLVLVASVIAPRSWQDRPDRARLQKPGLRERWRTLWRRWSLGGAQGQLRFRRQALELNPFYWLAGRARLKPVHVWTFLACMAAWWLAGWLTSGRMWFEDASAVVATVLLNTTFKAWAAIEAGQQLGEERKSGTLELLLSTPLSVHEILRGQWLALRRQFLKPLLVVIGLELFFMLKFLQGGYIAEVFWFWVAGIFMLLADMWAIIWVAMWQSLTAKNQHQAMLKTFVQILFLPWLVGLFVAGLVNVWVRLPPGTGWRPDWQFHLALWSGLGLAADLGFGLTARWRLSRSFRQCAVPQFVAERPSQAWWRRFAGAHATASEGSPELPAGRADSRREAAHISGRASASAQSRGSSPSLRRRRLVVATGVTAVLAIGCLLFLSLRTSERFPPPLTVRVGGSKAPLRVYATMTRSALLILPDGSLWRWGQAGVPGLPPAIVPERIGTNCDWTQAAELGSHAVALRRDGTLWEWNAKQASQPHQVDAGRDWIGVAAGGMHAAALRRDGTLWTWGNNGLGQLGIGRGLLATNLVQVGTNHDWTAVSCQWAGTLALRADGTLWAWGQINTYRGGIGGVTSLPVPTRVCQETNWAALSPGWSPLAWTRTGELWEPLYASPNPDAPAAAVGRLLLTNSVPDRVATAYCGMPKLYQIRADGSLWERDFAISPSVSISADKWRRVGQRSDWVSLWGTGSVALGLTRDGTLWTWGLDPTGLTSPGFFAKLKSIQAIVRARLARPGASMGFGASPGYQKEPRPLLRLVPE